MTAPLYEVKNKFSEYVARAQNGEVIEVQKHGKPAVVIVDAEKYYSQNPRQNDFMAWYKPWRENWEKILREEGEKGMDVFWEALENARKDSKPRPNAFLEALGIDEK